MIPVFEETIDHEMQAIIIVFDVVLSENRIENVQTCDRLSFLQRLFSLLGSPRLPFSLPESDLTAALLARLGFLVTLLVGLAATDQLVTVLVLNRFNL